MHGDRRWLRKNEYVSEGEGGKGKKGVDKRGEFGIKIEQRDKAGERPELDCEQGLCQAPGSVCPRQFCLEKVMMRPMTG